MASFLSMSVVFCLTLSIVQVIKLISLSQLYIPIMSNINKLKLQKNILLIILSLSKKINNDFLLKIIN